MARNGNYSIKVEGDCIHLLLFLLEERMGNQGPFQVFDLSEWKDAVYAIYGDGEDYERRNVIWGSHICDTCIS